MDAILEFLNGVGVTWPKFLAQLIVFVVGYFVLSRYAFKPIIQVLEERRTRIEESQRQVEEIKLQLAAAEERQKQILGEANEQARKLIDEAKASGSELAEQKKQEAIHEAERILLKAREQGQLESRQMMADLKRELGHLVVETTTKVTGKILNAEDQKRISEEAARRVAA